MGGSSLSAKLRAGTATSPAASLAITGSTLNFGGAGAAEALMAGWALAAAEDAFSAGFAGAVFPAASMSNISSSKFSSSEVSPLDVLSSLAAKGEADFGTATLATAAAGVGIAGAAAFADFSTDGCFGASLQLSRTSSSSLPVAKRSDGFLEMALRIKALKFGVTFGLSSMGGTGMPSRICWRTASTSGPSKHFLPVAIS